MRELKFRAWTRNSWIKDEMIYNWQDKTYVESVGFVPSDDDIPVMQFTGLYDRNGKEVYEGDIIQFQRAGYSNKPKFVVDFRNGSFYLQSKHPGYDSDYIHDYNLGEHCEVIGNIYENPGLIEQ